MSVSDYIYNSVAVENSEFTVVLPERTYKPKNDITLLTLHSHSFYEVFCCVSGKIEILAETNSYCLSGGDILIMPPGISHRMSYDCGNSVFCTPGFYINEKGNYTYSDIYSSIMTAVINKEPKLYKKAYDFCRIAYDLTYGISFTSYPALQMLACLLSLDKAERNISFTDSLLFELDSIVNNEFMMNISSEIVANRLKISVRQLSRIVKKRYGSSLHKVLTLKRLETAAEMLRSTNKSVENISLEVGYKSLSCFYREFGKQYGTTPAEYRSK